MAKESIGCLWSKQGQKGEYLSGNIKFTKEQLLALGELPTVEIPIIVFKNDKGDNEARPDWRIFKSEPKKKDDNQPPF